MSSANSHSTQLFPRRKFLQLAPTVALIPALITTQPTQQPTPNLYQAALDLSAQTIELAVAAMKLRDGNGTVEEARAQLVELK
jgi:hypothetical protein